LVKDEQFPVGPFFLRDDSRYLYAAYFHKNNPAGLPGCDVAPTELMFYLLPLAKVGTFLQTKKKKRLIIFKTKNYIYNAPCNSLFSVKKPGGPSRLARFS
jgi:hypothetical protein